MNEERQQDIWNKVVDEIESKNLENRFFTWEELETVSVSSSWPDVEPFAFGKNNTLWNVIKKSSSGILARRIKE